MSKFRTLIRITQVFPDRDFVHIVVPGWDVNQNIRIDKKYLPARSNLFVGKRLHAKVNLGAKGFEDLDFSDWEDK